ncbi:MAG: hypothetical protein AVDCRST_MAG56-4353 [uncultured Cytophagales bacterium]|uniref:Uncharacterized protein n=1 Tax=uncultured Cytophagales bacterium TaxID=158755 RepID=A0A6J4JVK3_9SPHI|nr:MAG: hypothetical protein AVDCRST_MAG56-4353 [uncultured Cytophagales bacterium]
MEKGRPEEGRPEERVFVQRVEWLLMRVQYAKGEEREKGIFA